MRALVSLLVLASLLVAPAASAYHDGIPEVCESDGGDGVVGTLHTLAVHATCSGYHLVTTFLLQYVDPIGINDLCEVFLGQKCV